MILMPNRNIEEQGQVDEVPNVSINQAVHDVINETATESSLMPMISWWCLLGVSAHAGHSLGDVGIPILDRRMSHLHH
jgi:hypothetical protein